ncbi:MAG: hypothetical protein LBI57_05380 [Helicobacteraceae bacterium]|jgi:hypothetical protein|nr:hypothetical protein [Helicobacteraceae bacterium]
MQINDIAAQSGRYQTAAQNGSRYQAAAPAGKEAIYGTDTTEKKISSATDFDAQELKTNAARLSANEFYAQAKASRPTQSQSDENAGAAQTAERLALFAANAAEDDENLLRSAKEGLAEGYETAEQNWGGALPQTARETLERAVETIDLRLHSLGFALLRTIA